MDDLTPDSVSPRVHFHNPIYSETTYTRRKHNNAIYIQNSHTTSVLLIKNVICNGHGKSHACLISKLQKYVNRHEVVKYEQLLNKWCSGQYVQNIFHI